MCVLLFFAFFLNLDIRNAASDPRQETAVAIIPECCVLCLVQCSVKTVMDTIWKRRVAEKEIGTNNIVVVLCCCAPNSSVTRRNAI